MEIAAGVASHDFELAIDGFNGIGSGEGTTNGSRVIEEVKVMGLFSPEVVDKLRRTGVETVAELIKRESASFGVPRGLGVAPTLLEFSRIRF
jgi:hypothetical protein